MRYAIVNSETNVVENVIVWDGETEYEPNEGYIVVPASEQVSIGWHYVDGELQAP
jgi:hypothetical protein